MGITAVRTVFGTVIDHAGEAQAHRYAKGIWDLLAGNFIVVRHAGADIWKRIKSVQRFRNYLCRARRTSCMFGKTVAI